ncbi:hypothetical protein FHU10_1234 [Serratia fonticola]|uniref:DUF3102 domain-containing protein n=1 Tax=Serratia fonticola TaxID=47917 RepID=A0A542BJG8_SERFO|nr:hypothetical protein [Serratia fonticola]TQI78725.1 hypothetical protein FHU09_1217 [Serratia fonticola]TQI99253.1 hypothetical protein FHU11_4835 [Serratia fonticola]TVZ68778.1 hypothetical protein FHU10_1234 [Serratia fonticola]
MARKPSPTSELLPDTQLNPELAATQNIMATIQSEFHDERDLLNQLLGQAQMAGASEDFFRTVRTSKLAFVKENKLYRQLKGSKSPHGAEFLSGTWEEFCNILGRSVDQVDRDITNLRSFGEEALDSMSRMGIGYRELGQFRRLPADQKSALIEVAKEGDKNALLELAEEMIAKHTKEKEDLATDLEISRQTLAENKEKLSRVQDEKSDLEEKLLRRVKRETPEAEGSQLVQEVNVLVHAVIADLTNLENGFTTLNDHTERTGIPHVGLMAGLLDDIQTRVTVLRQQFNLPEHQPHDPRPDWVKGELDNQGGDDA